MANAVRHCIECRFQRFDTARISPSTSSPSKPGFKDPLECILELTSLLNTPPDEKNEEDIDNLLLSSVKNFEFVLQDLDIHRLRAILYRDVVRQDRSKTGKNVVIVVVNPSNIFFLFFALCVLCACALHFFVSLSLIDEMFVHRMIRNNHNFYHW